MLKVVQRLVQLPPPQFWERGFADVISRWATVVANKGDYIFALCDK